MSREGRQTADEKAILVRDEDGGSRIVPCGDVVEGEDEDDSGPSPPIPAG